MKRLNLTALFGCLVLVAAAVGCGGGEAEEPEIVIIPAAEIELRSALENVSESELVATVRGPGQIGYLQPVTQRDGSEMVTTFRIENRTDGALAGFKVDEFWYDRAGDTVSGGSFRLQKPLLEGQIVEGEVRIARNSRRSRSNYEFSHKNGVIEATVAEEMDEPTPLEEEEGEEGEEEDTEA